MSTITEEEVETFLHSLRAGDVDKKVNLVQLWGIKLEGLQELPDRTIDAITLLTSPFIRSPSHLLVTSTLSGFLPYFLPLIPASTTQTHLRVAVLSFLPALIEKLNDPKDKIHAPARECVVLLGIKCYQADNGLAAPTSRGKEKDTLSTVWESSVKEALAGRGARVKLEALKVLLKLRNESKVKLPLKPWLPNLVTLLEDSDGTVRDSARETVVDLLSPPSTPAAARSELKKLMLARGVRKSISDSIIARVLGGAASAPHTAAREGTSTPASLRASASRTEKAPSSGDDIEIVYIASARDLDHELKAMIPHFAGKETEHNWGPRERSLIRVRGMLRGKVFLNQPDAFLHGLRSGFVEGVAKTLMSLRTTVAQQSCALVQELAETLGPAFDPSVDILLPALGKMAGFTKRIIAEKSQKAVTSILVHSSPAPTKLVGHIAAAVQDKSVQARQYGAGHLRTYLDAQAKGHRGMVESAPGVLEQLVNLLKRCLADTNPLVREHGRLAFWSFDKVWPSQATIIMNSLDGTARKQLEKANPHMGSTPVSGKLSKPRTPRSSAMSALLAAKRAQAAELAAKRVAEGEDPKEPIIEVLPVEGSPRQTQRSSSSAPSEGTVTPRRGAESPAPVPTPPEEARPAEVPSTPSPTEGETGGTGMPEADGQCGEGPPLLVSTPEPLASTRVEERDGHIAASSRATSASAEMARPQTPLNNPVEDFTASDNAARLEDSAVSGSSTAAAHHTPKSNSRKSGIPIRSPPRNSASSPSARPISTQRSSLTSSISRTSTLSRTISRSPSLKMDTGHPSLRHLLGNETPPQALHVAGQSRLLQPHPAQHDVRRLSNSRDTGPPVPFLDHLPNSPADEQIRAQAAQAFSAAQQLLDFDDDQDTMIDVPMTPVRHPTKAALLSSAYRTPSSGFTRQPWEDSPKAMTPKLLKVLQSRGYERSWWTERKKLLDQMDKLKQSLPSVDDTIENDVESLVMGEPTVLNLQAIALFSSSNPIPSAAESQSESGADAQVIWTETRLFDRVFEGLIDLLRPGLAPDILEQGIVTLWELIQNQWTLCEDREDSLLDALFHLRTSTNSIVLEATNALVSLLTEVCDPPFLLSLLHSALDRFISGAGDREVQGDRATAAGYSFGLNAMGMCVLHLPREAVEVEAKQLAGPVMDALRLDSSSTVMARQAAHRVILAVQCVIADDVKTLALFPRLTPGQRSFATYLMQQNGVMGKAGGEAEADARRRAVLSELVGGLAKGARFL